MKQLANPAAPQPFTRLKAALITATMAAAFFAPSLAFATSAPLFTSGTAVSFPQNIAGSFTITTSGDPTAVITQTGKLPGGVKFIDNGDGTATLSGRPGNGVGQLGNYPLTFTASNGISPAATQNFTLTITRPPVITSVNNATFVVGTLNTFVVTTRNTNPKSALSFVGTLPAGVNFTPAGNGTATLSGIPTAGTQGTYNLTITAANGTLPNATQNFKLRVQTAQPILQAPAITSSTSTTFTVYTEGIFTVRSTGTPTATLTPGTLPTWLTFIDNTDGTATLVGAPDPGGPASYTLTITATNGVSPAAVQTFTLLVVDTSPAITSANNATFVASTANTFTVRTKATDPVSTLSFSGVLPTGVTFMANTNGTATLSGTPAIGSVGTYQLTITATNGTVVDATQIFTLTVQTAPIVPQAPAITSVETTIFTAGTPGTFDFTATGTPTPRLTLAGPRPSWLSYVDNTDGSATLSGTPDQDSDATYTFTLTAANGIAPIATQTFTLIVTQAPRFTSSNSAAFQAGTPGSFNVTTLGNPVAIVSKTGGVLPAGVSLVNNGDGTATIAGTPAAGSQGTYPITISATNGIGSNATTQTFTLTVSSAAPTPTPSPSATPTPSPSPSTTPAKTRLLNISTRLLTQTGDNVAIGGFIITGNSPKKVIIRGIGPSLAASNIPFPLLNPTLELHNETTHTIVAINDDWQSTPNRGQIPNGFSPADPRESVIIGTLQPGPYTVIQSGKDGTSGVGLVEVYDLDSATVNAMVANISTRGVVQTGDKVMIGGFITGGGTGPSKVIIRAIGPSLRADGISNALDDPKLELHNANGALIRSNDNWKDDPTQIAELTTLGFAPKNDLESTILTTLPAGSYTAIVAGKNNGIGVALVEVYNIP